MSKPKVLILDIETSPIVSFTWGLFDQNVAVNQIKEDWNILAWCAKWLDEKQIFYQDVRKAKIYTDDKQILKQLWDLMDQADIIVGQNVKSFDIKKINARFLVHGMKPPSGYRVIDTRTIAKRHFAFTSNKLEYMSDKFNAKYRKLKHTAFPGFSLWIECMAGNPKAWNEMKRYNIQDVMSTEELYKTLIPWDATINFGVYTGAKDTPVCSCGSTSFKKRGFQFTNAAKKQRYECLKCGRAHVGKKNLLIVQE